jgi:hypothetical protein
MMAPGTDDDFRASLPDNTNSEQLEPRKRKPRADAGQPRGPKRGKVELPAEPIDPILERAKRKFATLGGGTTVKKVFQMLDKPLDAKEAEDVDDYFYLVAKKGNLDPSQSWVIMIVCGLILILTLLGTRTSIGESLKEIFAPKKKAKPEKDATEKPVELPAVEGTDEYNFPLPDDMTGEGASL